MTVVNFIEKKIIMNLKNVLRVMKHLILLSCFCVSVSYAGANQKNTFVELTTFGLFQELNLSSKPGVSISVGLGYKHTLDSTNYFGYVLADINVGTSAFSEVLLEAPLMGKLNLEYGYEFMRDSLFSFGLNVSPIVPYLFFPKDDWSLMLVSFLGVFGNFNINDSFEIAIEIKVASLAPSIALDSLLYDNDAGGKTLFLLVPMPFFEVKGRYYF